MKTQLRLVKNDLAEYRIEYRYAEEDEAFSDEDWINFYEADDTWFDSEHEASETFDVIAEEFRLDKLRDNKTVINQVDI